MFILLYYIVPTVHIRLLKPSLRVSDAPPPKCYCATANPLPSSRSKDVYYDTWHPLFVHKTNVTPVQLCRFGTQSTEHIVRQNGGCSLVRTRFSVQINECWRKCTALSHRDRFTGLYSTGVTAAGGKNTLMTTMTIHSPV